MITELWTTEEVAASRRVSTRKIRDLVREGKVTPLRTSGGNHGPMRFGPEQLAQIDRAMTPQAPATRQRKIRLPRAAQRGT